jgi:hypothetical protein
MKINARALSLAELIVSTFLVSIVVLTIAATDYSLRRMDKNSTSDTKLLFQLNALSESIRLDVKRVHGYAGDTGITVDTANQTICFRYDAPEPTDYTPQTYTDDHWSCYTQLASDTRVFQCTFDGASGPTGQCAATDTYVGSLVTDQFTNTLITNASIPKVTNTADGTFYFRMLLVGRDDPSVGAAVNAGALTKGTSDNPQVLNLLQENIGDL